MQIVLGFVQVLLFLILLFNYDKFSEKIKSHLTIYGVLTGCYLLWFFSGYHPKNDWMLLLITLVPMSIGTYFTYIVYQLKKKVL
jgi:multisubunit Na+/H+ antiporter MnhE subunit